MSRSWRPPTPPSVLNALPPPPLTTTTFDPLPPPLTATFAVSQSKTTFSENQSGGKVIAGLLDEREEEEYYSGTARVAPASFGGRRLSDAPERGYFPPHDINELYEGRLIDTHSLAPPPRNASLPASQSSTPAASPRVPIAPTKRAPEEKKISPRKRPRREAAVPKSVPERELSPLDGDTTYGKPATTGSQSNRKVSHSLIERRRREKINECLASLKQMVPHCREEGERKEARAKERGRKRGKKVDGEEEEASRGGLHKLEILQGTILYIEELEAKIVTLETAAVAAPLHRQVLDLNNPSPPASQSRSFSPLSPVLDDRLVQNALAFPPINSHYSNHNFLTTAPAPPSSTTRPAEFDYHASNKLPPIRAYSYSSNSSAASSTLGLLAPQRHGNSSVSDLMSSRSNSGPNSNSFITDAEDHEAGLLLLKFSTSPELRPVFYD